MVSINKYQNGKRRRIDVLRSKYIVDDISTLANNLLEYWAGLRYFFNIVIACVHVFNLGSMTKEQWYAKYLFNIYIFA